MFIFHHKIAYKATATLCERLFCQYASLLERRLQLRPVEAEDELAVDVGHGDAAELAAAFCQQLFFGRRVFLDIFGGVCDAEAIEPLLLCAAKCAPRRTVDNDLRVAGC